MRAAQVKLRRLAVPLLGAAASALLLGLYGRIEAPWAALGWVALVPWLLALDRAGSPGEALLSGGVLGAGFTLSVCGWFVGAVQDYTEAPRLACSLFVVVFSPIFEPQFLTFALARHLARRTAPAGGRAFLRVALTGALVYVGTEWWWPKLFADTLGQGLYPSFLLRQVADLAGVRGLTFILLLANECVLAGAKALWAPRGQRPEARPSLAPAALLAVLVGGCFGYGYLRARQVEAHTLKGRGFVVGLVQANITHYDRLAAEEGGYYEVVRKVLDAHYALSDGLLRSAKADLIVWPETIYPTTFGSPKSDDGGDLDREIAAFASQRDVPLIFGSYDQDQRHEYNAAMFLEPSKDGRLDFTSYRKAMLFPLTEYVPEWLDSERFRRWFPWTGTWKQGPGPRAIAFRLRGGRPITIAPLICYEDTFPGFAAGAVRQGAELIVTMSNDSWFPESAARQHLRLAAFRSIETRRPQVRVANSGISALISPTGELVAQTPMAQRAALNVTVPPVAPLPTLFVAWGDWLGPTGLVGGIGLLLQSALSARRRKAPPGGA